MAIERSVQTGRRCRALALQRRPRRSSSRMDESWGRSCHGPVKDQGSKDPSTLGLTEADLRKLHEQISDMTIEVVPADSIKTNPRNAKRHPEQQISPDCRDMRKLGVYDPILIDENNMIIGGHARMAAAKLLKLANGPIDLIAKSQRTRKAGRRACRQ